MGNRQQLIIPMEQEVIPQEGDPYTEDFYPAEDDVVKVTLTGAYRPYIYTPEVDGHLLILTDNGTLPKGLYGVQITVVGANGETRLRSFWDQQIIVTEKNNSVLQEWDEFKQQAPKARAAVFFFAKGDPGTTDYNELENKPFIPTALKDLTEDATHRVVTDNEKITWNNKANVDNGFVQCPNGIDINSESSEVFAITLPFSDNYGQSFYRVVVLKRFSDNTLAVGNSHSPDVLIEYNNGYISVKSLATNVEYLQNNIGTKTDKVIGATNGNFAGLDTNGNLIDSGKNASDFATAVQGAKADTAYQVPQEGIPESDLEHSVQQAIDNVPSILQYIEAIAQIVPEQASSENQLADKAFVNSSIQTNTASFKGTYNLVNDLSLTTSATQQAIGTALASAISGEDNNDYCFVQIPTADATPLEIARIDRYKYDGSAWAFEWSLNNSSFASAQWAAINSGITSSLVTKLSDLPTNAQLNGLLSNKQNNLISGANIKTIDGKSVLGNGDLEVAKTFVAIYGTTTYQEIITAHMATKHVTAAMSNNEYEFVSFTQDKVTFVRFEHPTSRSYIYCSSNNVWSIGESVAMQDSSQKVTSFGQTPSDTNYPSEKLVYDNIIDTPDFIEEEVTEEMVDEFTELRTDLYQALTDAQQVTTNAFNAATLANQKATLANNAASSANNAATNANDKANLANTKAEYANDQGNYAKSQGDYAKQQAEIIDEMDWIEFVEDNTDTNPFDI